MEDAVCEKSVSVEEALGKIWSKLPVDIYLDEEAVKDHPSYSGGSSVEFFFEGEVIIDHVAEAMVDVGLFPDFESVSYSGDGLASRVTDAVYHRLNRVELLRKSIATFQKDIDAILTGSDL